MRFHEDDRAQRLIDLFPIEGQINVSYIQPEHITAWHKHRFQYDYFICIQGAFKIGLHDGKIEKWEYLSDKNPKVLEIPPDTWHGYKALQPNSILLYYMTKKYDPNDIQRCSPGSFDESWETENK